MLELQSVLACVRRFARTVRCHEHRIILFVDSQVVLGGLRRGRSSSRRLNRVLQRLTALCFACDVLLHVFYVPSAENPSDPPSRAFSVP